MDRLDKGLDAVDALGRLPLAGQIYDWVAIAHKYRGLYR